MKTLLNIKWRYLKPSAAIIAGGCALFFMRPDGYKDVTQELIGLFGLLMAGVLPTMVLTASALKAGNLSVNKIITYNEALSKQLKVWIGLFTIALIACSLVIFGKMVQWSLNMVVPLSILGLTDIQYNLVGIVNALISACLTLVIIRGLDVGKGIVSLLRLTGEIALSEAKLRDQERHRAGDDAIKRLSNREGFGEYVEIKH